MSGRILESGNETEFPAAVVAPSDSSMCGVLHFKHPDLCNEQGRISCRRAVDCCLGRLVDLSIECCCTRGLLNYIVERPNHIKRLTLQDCNGFTMNSEVEAVNKLPHLEELRLIRLPGIQAADIVNIGKSCPLLKSFTFNQNGFTSDLIPDRSRTLSINKFGEKYRNEYALAIGKNMPNLCHLRLNSISITNEGLESILDGCPNLDSVDLRQCLGLDLGGALGKRCSEKIKHLKLPFDSVSYSEYVREPVKFAYFSDDD